MCLLSCWEAYIQKLSNALTWSDCILFLSSTLLHGLFSWINLAHNSCSWLKGLCEYSFTSKITKTDATTNKMATLSNNRSRLYRPKAITKSDNKMKVKTTILRLVCMGSTPKIIQCSFWIRFNAALNQLYIIILLNKLSFFRKV